MNYHTSQSCLKGLSRLKQAKPSRLRPSIRPQTETLQTHCSTLHYKGHGRSDRLAALWGRPITDAWVTLENFIPARWSTLHAEGADACEGELASVYGFRWMIRRELGRAWSAYEAFTLGLPIMTCMLPLSLPPSKNLTSFCDFTGNMRGLTSSTLTRLCKE